METTMHYVRSKVLKYFTDSGLSESKAQKKLDKMTDTEVFEIYETEPYFNENGY
jgi:hypothetical protein